MQFLPAISQPANRSPLPPQPRLERAAHEFEAQLMKELLQPMTQKGALTGSDDSDSDSNAALSEFASEALGKALSQGGGFGIAKSLIHDLSHSGSAHQSGTVNAISRPDGVISASKSLK